MDQTKLYRDIAGRCDGDIYLGVVGPVRTGKSTFIKRFMELLVLPNMIGGNRERAIDELPQSGAGRTIMTTQPKFIPNEAVEIELRDSAVARVRLVDCVGYLIPGVLGLNEGDESRMVRTPWFDHDIPFEDAAEIGTRKVIQEHSTIGVVITTDGSVVDMPRSAYKEAEERVVRELKARGYTLYLLSNAARRQHTYWHDIPGSECFSGTLISADVHLLKPEAAIYQALFDKFDLTAASCLFIDDFPPNIEAAENAGMQGIVFHDAGQLREELKARGIL